MKQALAFLVMLLLTGCALGPMEDVHQPVPFTVPVPTVQGADRVPMEVLILVPDSERAIESVDINSYPILGTRYFFHYKVGEAIEGAAMQAYGQVFDRIRVSRQPQDARLGLPVLQPHVQSFHVRFDSDTLLYSVQVDLVLTVSLGGSPIWQRSASRQASGQANVIGDAVGQALHETATQLVGDHGLRRQLAEASRPGTASKKVASRRNEPREDSPRLPPPPPTPAPATAAPAPRFMEVPVVTRFPRGPERPDDIAVIIGNADYSRQGKDIPNVKPAHADAEGARLYATQALGIKEGNVIRLKDATGSQMTRVFGSKDNHQGQLFDWVKPGKSRVYVYYSGHGAPGSQGGSPYLVPADADAARIELNGYPLKQLYDNLSKLPADSVTVVLEACFSGVSPAGSVLGKASPVFFEVKAPPVPANLTVIAAGAANQMASWESDESSGLFTKYYLKGMAGEADADKDGRVSLDELDRYLKGTLTYFARRHYGRDQNAQIVKGGGR